MNTLAIRALDAALLERLLPLIADYQRFYEQTPDDARNRHFFSQLLGESPMGIQFAALTADGEPVGFATLYVIPSSLTAMPYCLLNDLYTLPAYRGQGVGRALIAHCQAYARSRGFSEIEWVTHESNRTAQRLYDGLGASRSAWYTYTLDTGV